MKCKIAERAPGITIKAGAGERGAAGARQQTEKGINTEKPAEDEKGRETFSFCEGGRKYFRETTRKTNIFTGTWSGIT